MFAWFWFKFRGVQSDKFAFTFCVAGRAGRCTADVAIAVQWLSQYGRTIERRKLNVIK